LVRRNVRLLSKKPSRKEKVLPVFVPCMHAHPNSAPHQVK
jgi:hypothetical protein